MSDDMKDGYNFNLTWLAIGFGVGIALGVALDNIAVGIAIGAGIGIAFSMALPRKGDDESGCEQESVSPGRYSSSRI